MNCLKLHLDVPCVTIPSETLPPIPEPFLFSKPYEVKKPSWCNTPNITLQFEEIGSLKYREIGNEPYQLIGRNDRCHIILNDVMVSRCHALLLHTTSGESYILDINSSHGTYLGNVRLTPFVPTLVKKCSVIRFGSADQQYIIREYPKVDDVLKKSNGCESIEEKEVVLNTFHNITCLSSCTSALPKSLSLSKLFGRTPTAESSRLSQEAPHFDHRSRPYEEVDGFRDSPASNDELMSICTSGESSSSSDNSQGPGRHQLQLSTDVDLQQPASSPFISPRFTIPQNHFLSLSIPLDFNNHLPALSPHNHLGDIEIISVSPSPSSSSHSGNFDFLEHQTSAEQVTPGKSEEESIQMRKCLRRSYSVDSNIRAIPQNCFYISPTSSSSAAASSSSSTSTSNGLLNPLNLGRRTCSVDLTMNTKCNRNSVIAGRKRVRFSLSEFDLSKHQERINIAETQSF